MSGSKLFYGTIDAKCPIGETSPGTRHNKVSTGCGDAVVGQQEGHLMCKTE